MNVTVFFFGKLGNFGRVIFGIDGRPGVKVNRPIRSLEVLSSGFSVTEYLEEFRVSSISCPAGNCTGGLDPAVISGDESDPSVSFSNSCFS